MSGQKRIRLLKVISDVHMSHQLTDLILRLDAEVDLRCIFISTQTPAIYRKLRTKGVHCQRMNGGTIPLMIKLIWQMIKWRPDVVHSHLRRANLSSLPASFILMILKRIHTRHSSDYNHIYHPSSVKIDRLINLLSTHIVSISEVVSNVLIEGERVHPDKISLIHHGFDLKAFENISESRKEAIRAKYDIPRSGLIIGVVSRWLELKGIPHIIGAFKGILVKYPDAVLLLANATGPFKKEVEQALSSIDKDLYRIIPFEEDMPALYQLMSFHIHTPISPTCEAFGQTYVESLASGIPAVVTLSGVAHEFIRHRVNAMVVPYRDVDSLVTSVIELENDPSFKESLIENGKEDVLIFSLDRQVKRLKEVYE